MKAVGGVRRAVCGARCAVRGVRCAVCGVRCRMLWFEWAGRCRGAIPLTVGASPDVAAVVHARRRLADPFTRFVVRTKPEKGHPLIRNIREPLVRLRHLFVLLQLLQQGFERQHSHVAVQSAFVERGERGEVVVVLLVLRRARLVVGYLGRSEVALGAERVGRGERPQIELELSE